MNFQVVIHPDHHRLRRKCCRWRCSLRSCCGRTFPWGGSAAALIGGSCRAPRPDSSPAGPTTASRPSPGSGRVSRWGRSRDGAGRSSTAPPTQETIPVGWEHAFRGQSYGWIPCLAKRMCSPQMFYVIEVTRDSKRIHVFSYIDALTVPWITNFFELPSTNVCASNNSLCIPMSILGIYLGNCRRVIFFPPWPPQGEGRLRLSVRILLHEVPRPVLRRCSSLDELPVLGVLVVLPAPCRYPDTPRRYSFDAAQAPSSAAFRRRVVVRRRNALRRLRTQISFIPSIGFNQGHNTKVWQLIIEVIRSSRQSWHL